MRRTQVRHPYPTSAGEADADALLRLSARSLTEVLEAAGPGAAGRIAGVGVSTFWHGLLGADDDGQALTPVLLWGATRSSEASERLRARLDAEAVRQRTGCPIHSSYWPAKLAWLREVRPELWRRPVRWISLGDLLFQRLFGRLGTSLSMASGTGLFQLDGMRWDDELLDVLGVPETSLPPIAESVRALLPRHRRAWPALADVPWFHALGDGALANLGSGCTVPSRRAVTIGTSAAMRVMHPFGASSAVPQGLWRYRLDGSRLVTGGALSSGGNLREWLESTLRVGGPGLERRLRSMPPAGHGLTVLPHLAGERAPGYAAHAFGAVAGLTISTTAEEILQAGLESVAIELAGIGRRLDKVAPRAARLVASGAASLRSAAWMQMVADATGRSVVEGVGEASSRGAALYALERLGIGKAAGAGLGRVYRPRAAAGRAFAVAAGRQEVLYKALIGERNIGP